ncbi:MAG: cysteine hydrolase [Oscillospiraceae bacterium]|nr:cysteine hydrolase [Oscillospiraceae bacterium]
MAKIALIVTEMQNDYLWAKRKDKFPYDTDTLVSAVNAAIDTVHAAGGDVIYIAQIFPDTPSNHLIFGYNITGTEGAELFGDLHRVSELYFEKNVSDLFTDAKFREWTEAQGYEELLFCGVDECACIAATAKHAAESGMRAVILEKASATRFDARKKAMTRAELKAAGVQYRAEVL